MERYEYLTIFETTKWSVEASDMMEILALRA